jgi:hypothetical protein
MMDDGRERIRASYRDSYDELGRMNAIHDRQPCRVTRPRRRRANHRAAPC